jgi:hypothetical protein
MVLLSSWSSKDLSILLRRLLSSWHAWVREKAGSHGSKKPAGKPVKPAGSLGFKILDTV